MTAWFSFYYPHPDKSVRALGFAPCHQRAMYRIKDLLARTEPQISADFSDDVIFLKVCT